MFFELITLFPGFYTSFFRTGLMKRAVGSGVIHYRILGMRKYGDGRLKKVDDTPFGGAEGMLIKKNVLEKCLRECSGEYVVSLSPRGHVLTRNKVKELVEKKSLTLICGHYEGVDQRFIDRWVDEEISIGDYVLSGGETASLVLMETLSRYLEGFMGNPCSHQNESFEGDGLEHDQYTQPFTREVPAVLKSGHHARIREWKWVNGLIRTYRHRPDLLKRRQLSPVEAEEIKNYFYRQLTYRV